MTTDHSAVVHAATVLAFLWDVYQDAALWGGDSELYRERAALMRDLASALHASPAMEASATALVHGLNLLHDHAVDSGQDGRAEMLHQRLVLATMVTPGAGAAISSAAEAVPIWEAFVAWHEEQVRILAHRSPVPGAVTSAEYQTRRDVLAAELAHLHVFAQAGR